MKSSSIPVNNQPFGEPIAPQLSVRRFGLFGGWLPNPWACSPDLSPEEDLPQSKEGPCKKERRNSSESTFSFLSSDLSSDSSLVVEVGRCSAEPAKKGDGHGHGHKHKHHFLRPFMPIDYHYQRHGPPFEHCERGSAVDLTIPNGDNEDFYIVQPDEILASDFCCLNISEFSTKKRYKLLLHELRDYEPNEVKVSQYNDELTVKATRTKESEPRSVTRSETFVITIPADVDMNSVMYKLKPQIGLSIRGTKSKSAKAVAAAE